VLTGFRPVLLFPVGTVFSVSRKLRQTSDTQMPHTEMFTPPGLADQAMMLPAPTVRALSCANRLRQRASSLSVQLIVTMREYHASAGAQGDFQSYGAKKSK